MKFNVVAAMEAPFYVNLLMQLWRTLEVSHISRVFKNFGIFGIFGIFQIDRNCNDASFGVSGR
jgi:hypothetical protein